MITIHIHYTGHNGSARKFAEEMLSSKTVEQIRAEQDPLDICFPIRVCVAKVAVKEISHLVAVQKIIPSARFVQVFLQPAADGRFSRPRDSNEPDYHAFFLRSQWYSGCSSRAGSSFRAFIICRGWPRRLIKFKPSKRQHAKR